jgi:class 3 adenylate cyclase
LGKLPGAHDELASGQVEGLRGRRVKTLVDGTLAILDGRARAIHCAAGIRDAVKALDLSVRAGLHTGEVELRADDVAGLADHIGARIRPPSPTGNESRLGLGSATRRRVWHPLPRRGRHPLKGVPEEWDVFTVESGA